MKAISLWQPWATLMALGLKTVETRHWATSYRGILVITAAKKWSKETERFCAEHAQIASALAEHNVTIGDLKANMGKAVCSVILRDCISTNTDSSHILSIAGVEQLGFGNYERNRYMWVTDTLLRFPKPIEVVGRQGLWNLPQSVVDEVQGQWAASALMEAAK